MLSRAALVPLLVVAFGSARAGESWEAPEPTPPRAAFLGSSTTAGVGASAPERRWTALVAERLGWTEVNLGLTGSTLATVPGRTVRSGEARWRADLAAARPDVVVVQYGANDAMLAVPLGSRGERGTFRHAAHEMLLGIRSALPGALLVVVEFQPSLATAESRAPYDSAVADAARAAGAVLIRAADAFLPGAHAHDSVHLNDAGHAAFADHVARALLDSTLHPAPAAAPAPGEGDRITSAPELDFGAAP